MDIAIDHLYCYDKGKPFYPLIEDGDQHISSAAHAAVVHLKASPRDDLNWSKEIESAKTIFAEGKKVLWELDFGFSNLAIDLDDQTIFHSCVVAIEEFSSKICKQFSCETFGVILYRGRGGFFSRIQRIREHFLDEQEERSSFQLELYSSRLFAQYLHRLASFLPDSVCPIALVDVSMHPSLAQTALIYSRRTFGHIHLGMCGTPLPISGFCWKNGGSFSGWIGSIESQDGLSVIGSAIMPPAVTPRYAICLPHSHTSLFLNQLESVLEHLLASKQAFRLICEEHLTEEWNELDHLLLFPNELSMQGKRMLQGFLAAGGEIIDIETLLSACRKES